MKGKLAEIKQEAQKALDAADDLKSLEDIRVKYLGKKSAITQIMKTLADIPPDTRPVMGKLINETRDVIERMIGEVRYTLTENQMETRLVKEAVDVTLPGKHKATGHKHPMTIITEELVNIFIGMGYTIADGPDVEDYYHNFEALNIPETHTARDEQDTFYIEGGFVLRSATSSVQVRTMEKNKPPIRIIAPGCVYRADAVDATHSPVFHQLEGLVIDKQVTMGNLKAALAVFAKELFGDKTRVRFRPHYFPFTEPSAEMDVTCFACGGKGCSLCKDSGFIEILGCGMVHPRVLSMSGIDPDTYTGFAFGMGLERIAMRKFNITDMRLLYENDVRFLKQF